MLAACSHLTGSPALPADLAVGALERQTPDTSFKTLHNFAGAPNDGATPEAGLIHAFGVLYGTTYAGGLQNGPCSSLGCGTEKVLHSFGGAGDGYFPQAGLLQLKGTFYGTTAGGSGTVLQPTR